MMTLQLRIGRTLLAASHCGQQTHDSIEETETRANIAAVSAAAVSEAAELDAEFRFLLGVILSVAVLQAERRISRGSKL